ncbi:MAG: amidohydrolase [Deltaproteobacteria bacterium]|nr:amidohydrolase [Deltaproteobacteria bacterium]
MRRPTVLGALAGSLVAGCATAGAPNPNAHGPTAPGARLYVGPAFVTADDGAAPLRAIAVGADGRIEAVYDAIPSPPPADALVVRLPGAVAVPGLVDAHVHLAWIGRAQETLDVHGAASPAEVRGKVAALRRQRPDLAVVTGGGWDQELFPDRAFPTAADLEDTGGGGLVALQRVDGHAIWVNAAGVALIERYLADQGGERPGERVLRGADGRPSGVVVDPSDALRKVLAAPETAADRERWLTHGLVAAARAGLVGVHFMAATVAELESLAAIARREGALPVRVAVYLGDDAATWAWLDAHPPGPVDVAPDVRVVGVKVFADGALGSRGAALLAPYSDAPGERGLMAPEETLLTAARRAHAHGLPIAIHAIGDRGNRVALDVIAAARGDGPALRDRIEHAQVVAPEDWSRFAALGVVASMQPTHATADMGFAEARLGRERLVGAYAWRTVLDRGIPLAFGSDAPVESVSPALGIHAAVTREDGAGEPAGGWLPDERLTALEAIRAYSRGAAYAVSEEADRGRFAPGYVFDATCFDVDATRDPRAWLEAAVTATVQGGRPLDVSR